LTADFVQAQGVVARNRRRIARPIVVQRTDSCIAPDHVGGLQGLREVAAGRAAEVGHFFVARACGRRIALHRHVGGADEGEPLLERNHEYHAPIVVLQDEGVLAAVAARHHDVAALDEAHLVGARLIEPLVEDVLHPGAGGVDDGARMQLVAVREPSPPALGAAGRPQSSVRTIRRAPRARASSALATTRRESSTAQSE
jgi:hypothetical protein